MQMKCVGIDEDLFRAFFYLAKASLFAEEMRSSQKASIHTFYYDFFRKCFARSAMRILNEHGVGVVGNFTSEEKRLIHFWVNNRNYEFLNKGIYIRISENI